MRRVVFDLITHLVGTQPRVSSHEELADRVWRRAGVSGGVIAKAVMEARRAIGDNESQPTMILSVRGLGYRFAAAVSSGAESVEQTSSDEWASQVTAAICRAELAMETADHALAQMAAERALALADDSGSSRLRIVALQTAALVACDTGHVDRLSELAHAALSLAKAERYPDLVASSQVEIARVHLMQGNSLLALELLKHVQESMLSQGPSRSRLRFETLMVRALSELQQFAEARAWCRRVQVTGSMLGDEFALCRERIAEVYLLLCEALWWGVEGHEQRVREASTLALEVSRLAGAMPCFSQSSDIRLLWLGNHCLALILNDDLEMASQAVAAIEEELAKCPSPHSLRVQGWRALQHGHTGMWLARSHRFTEAFEQVEAGIALAAGLNLQPCLALLHQHAVDISLRAGDHEGAFARLRGLRAIERRLMTEQATRLIAGLLVETDMLRVQEELAKAQARVFELERENLELVQRIRELDIDSDVDTQGYAKPNSLGRLWSDDHALARHRDMPFCLLALRVENYEELAEQLTQTALKSMFATIRRKLRSVDELRSPAVRWDSSVILIATRGVGSRRALELGAVLVAVLSGADWALILASELRPSFSSRYVDSASYADLSAALASVGLTAADHEPGPLGTGYQ